jgi:hypothetical protein
MSAIGAIVATGATGAIGATGFLHSPPPLSLLSLTHFPSFLVKPNLDVPIGTQFVE